MRAEPAWVSSFVWVLSMGCDAASPEDVDAGRSIPARCVMDPSGAGCPCDEERLVSGSSPTRHCCGGRWTVYYDGPCLSGHDAGGRDAAASSVDASSSDAGPRDCDPPAPGCPCSGSETRCRYNAWMLVCRDGVFVEDTLHACCGL
jgi:hypothetical protein